MPERPGLLHALPVCDLFLVLWIVFVLGSALSRQTGIAVELPASQFQLERYSETVVVSIAPGEGQAQLYFGRDAVTFEALQKELKLLHDKGAQANTLVLLRTDQAAPVGAQRRVEEMALDLDFRVAVLGAEEPQKDAPAEPEPEAP